MCNLNLLKLHTPAPLSRGEERFCGRNWGRFYKIDKKLVTGPEKSKRAEEQKFKRVEE